MRRTLGPFGTPREQLCPVDSFGGTVLLSYGHAITTI
jgi:hypothetical protein